MEPRQGVRCAGYHRGSHRARTRDPSSRRDTARRSADRRRRPGAAPDRLWRSHSRGRSARRPRGDDPVGSGPRPVRRSEVHVPGAGGGDRARCRHLGSEGRPVPTGSRGGPGGPPERGVLVLQGTSSGWGDRFRRWGWLWARSDCRPVPGTLPASSVASLVLDATAMRQFVPPGCGRARSRVVPRARRQCRRDLVVLWGPDVRLRVAGAATIIAWLASVSRPVLVRGDTLSGRTCATASRP